MFSEEEKRNLKNCESVSNFFGSQNYKMLKKLVLFEDGKESFARETLVQTMLQTNEHITPEIRLFIWSYLLTIFPTFKDKWKIAFKTYKQNYMMWISIYFKNKNEEWLKTKFPKNRVVKEFDLDENDIMFMIHGDISRISFTSMKNYGLIPDQKTTECSKLKHEIEEESQQRIFRRMERILYFFAALNPECSYAQGMHELIPPIFSVAKKFCDQKQPENDDEAEVLTFFLFHSLVKSTGLIDMFEMDKNMGLIVNHFNLVKTILKIADFQLFQKMFVENDINPLEFAFSWIITMFTSLYQETDLILLWDSIIAHIDDFLSFAISITVAQIIEYKNDIMSSDFSHILQILNHIEGMNIDTIIKKSENIYLQFKQSQKR